MKIKLLISLVAVLFVTVLYLLYLNIIKKPEIINDWPILPTFTPSPIPTISDSTAGWKTYTNTNYSLSFKYPFSSWNISENNGVISLVLKNDPGFDIEITKGNTEFDISKLSSNGVQIIKLGNISAKKISYLTPNSEKQVYFTFNNNTNYFTLLYKENSDSQVNQEITQILSTFKFTDNISQNNWVKRPNGDYQTSSNCLWLNTTKANDNGDLTQFVQKFYQTNSLDPLLSQVKYTVKNRETITISAQGVGELFTIYFSKDDKKYSITFNVSSLDNILNTEKCKNYQNDINFVLNNPDLFI